MLKTEEEAMAWLSRKDAKLKDVIERLGPLERPGREDLFEALIRQIVGQQIAMKAMWTVWGRLQDKFGTLTPEKLTAASAQEIQACGLSYRKANYIQTAARAVADGQVDLAGLEQRTDEEVIAELTKVKGIGRWTAQMLLLFTLGRPDVLAYDDLAIHRGMRMLYRHRRITRELFEKYRRRYSPYGSTASLYLWEVAMGALPELKDSAPLSQAEKKRRAKERRSPERTSGEPRPDAADLASAEARCEETVNESL